MSHELVSDATDQYDLYIRFSILALCALLTVGVGHFKIFRTFVSDLVQGGCTPVATFSSHFSVCEAESGGASTTVALSLSSLYVAARTAVHQDGGGMRVPSLSLTGHTALTQRRKLDT